MKKILAALLSLLLSNTLPVGATQTVQEDVPVEEKIVELHITFAPPPTPEVKKARKLMMKTKTGKAICSGSFISPYGHVLTARHCVQGTTEIEVVTNDGQEYKANIIAVSEHQDLAVIQVGRVPSPHFAIAETVTKGERIAIIGSPLGLTSLVTEGIVAKLGGDITFLDCTALPGNSGGPVLNTNGELVGVVSAMVVVFFGPAHISIVQSVNSIRFFFYEIMTGKYSGKK